MKQIILSITLMTICSGCAIGAGAAAVSGYSLISTSAYDVSPQCEQRIIDRMKKEIDNEIKEIKSKNNLESLNG